MGMRIKLPNIDFAKVGNTLVETSKTVDAVISNHVTEILAVALTCVTIDNICVRMGRKKDQKNFKENSFKQQQVIRKHEAEINVLMDEAKQAQEKLQKVDQLAQIVNNMTEGGLPNE